MSQLLRIRWGVRAVLILGIAVSVIANVLHARNNPISQSIAAWPPLALILTIELISRVPVHSPRLAWMRRLATASIAGIAAWVSYWHMAGVAARYGETTSAAHLIPLSVDGLVVVASICLVELGGRILAEQLAVARVVAQPAVPMPLPVPSTVPVFLPPPAAPDEPEPETEVGAPAPDEDPGQDVRQDVRSAQQIESAVRAMRVAEPKLPQRQIAAAVMVPETTVRRILRRTQPAAEQRINGHDVLAPASR